jgi:hypothetical protein
MLALAGLLLALPSAAQYPGQVAKSSKESLELRAIAVLEWTGEAGKPKASRLVPVAVLDGGLLLGSEPPNGQLQDGGIYLARPVPLALAGAVEYELQQNGKPVGLFDVRSAGQEQGAWVGHGAWKPLPVVKRKPSAEELAQNRINDEESDRPVLHRKKHPGESPGAGGSPGRSGSSNPGADADDASSRSSGSGSTGSTGSTGPAPASDPDRPTLHKKNSSDSTGEASTASASTNSASTNSASSTSTSDASTTAAADPGRPTLHKKDSSDSADDSSTSSAGNDPDRPTLKKSRKKQPENVGYVDSLPDVTDPDRPTLKRGKSSGDNLVVAPTLMGLPTEMQQTVAVSDAKSHLEHEWSYSWANPDDELKMKSALEEVARTALGLNPPSPAPAPRKTTARKSAKPAPPPPPPAALVDEQLRVFELSYGSGATMVLTAHAEVPAIDGAAPDPTRQKFVTLIAQPDLYGNLLVLLKSVTDGAHLDDSPRMRLVDPVDALADNRGELLFELRGSTQRQFALYRILRGQAEKLFVSSGGEFGTMSKD